MGLSTRTRMAHWILANCWVRLPVDPRVDATWGRKAVGVVPLVKGIDPVPMVKAEALARKGIVLPRAVKATVPVPMGIVPPRVEKGTALVLTGKAEDRVPMVPRRVDASTERKSGSNSTRTAMVASRRRKLPGG